MRHSFTSVAACVSVLVALSMGQAHAGNEYDKSIEQAAIERAVEKLGDIRGSHEINEPFFMYPPIEARSAANGLLDPADRNGGPVISPASLQGN